MGNGMIEVKTKLTLKMLFIDAPKKIAIGKMKNETRLQSVTHWINQREDRQNHLLVMQW